MINVIKKLNFKKKKTSSNISRELGVSSQTLKKHLKEMKNNNIVNHFTINIHPRIEPNLRYVLLEIKTNPNEPKLVENLLQIPQLRMLDGIFGEFSLIALFVFRGSEEFNKVLAIIDKTMANSYFKKYKISEIIRIYKTNGIKLSEVKITKKKLDNYDFWLLKILQDNQEMKLLSTYEISKILKSRENIELSQSTVYNRIKALEDSGVILNYCINFNPKKIGIEGKYIVRIKPKDPSKYKELALRLEKNPFITDLFRIGEQYGLFAIVRVLAIQDYGDFIKKLYKEEIEDTFTNFILDELVNYTNFILNHN
ncbi:MAG: hypothetical protein ACFFAS_10475 [Promethearchaeota archaeon]